MEDILNKKLEKNYVLINEYIHNMSLKKNVSNEIKEEIFGELCLFLMEPFKGISMESTIKTKTLIKRRIKIEMILLKSDIDFIKYCYRWINNNLIWTTGNLFYRRSKIMVDDNFQYDLNDDSDTIPEFEKILLEYVEINKLDEYLVDINEEDEERLLILRDVVESLPDWKKNLYKLYFRDGNNLAQTAKIVGLSSTSIFNLVKKLRKELNQLVNEKIKHL
jgi:RNA polymerase sigma factor (sigma-70 family)